MNSGNRSESYFSGIDQYQRPSLQDADTNPDICQMRIKLILIIALLLGNMPLFAQWQLSEEAEIHIVTCGPYQGELYSAFGHSAIRVTDPGSGIDIIYNYGIFNYNQPNFYLNFARGYMYYKLAASAYEGFRNYYISENRYIHEQVINLSPLQKQTVFNFLQWNARPENSQYRYDYFYDNCATRVRDVFTDILQDSIRFDSSYAKTGYTVRELCDMYLGYQPWGDLGIDLCLGMPMDRKMSTYQYMFLPDYVEAGFDQSQVYREGKWQPLVKETKLTYESRPENPPSTLWNPALLFWLVFLAGAVITYLGYRRKKLLIWWDVIIFSIVGLVGWLLLALWLFTDHEAAARNLNLLWALPFHFPLVLILSLGKRRLLAYYMRITAMIYFAVLVLWGFLPQDLHYSLIPLVLLLLVRSFYIQYHQLLLVRAEGEPQEN